MRGVEHERKYLVTNADVVRGSEGTSIVQGYLSGEGGTLRVRLVPAQGVCQLAVKGPRDGATRTELETEVDGEFAQAVLALCGGSVIEKTRYPVLGPSGQLWVVDVFHRKNEGLILAELELDSPEDEVDIPDWCGQEVTNDERYYNENLAVTPTPGI